VVHAITQISWSCSDLQFIIQSSLVRFYVDDRQFTVLFFKESVTANAFRLGFILSLPQFIFGIKGFVVVVVVVVQPPLLF
jgi:hypothetical protein